MDVYKDLKLALKRVARARDLSNENISIRCKALTPEEAIGNPEQDDYPIIKGREVMVEAVFEGARGQAFTDEFENADYSVSALSKMKLNSNVERASFVSGLNAVFRRFDLCGKTIHCKDAEPKQCAVDLPQAIGPVSRVLLVGYQPRFLEVLTSNYNTRVVDMDQDNIGARISGVVVEPPAMTVDALEWCDLVFATGSTVVNGSITEFISQKKPVLFYGVTISAAAEILNLNHYCQCGH